MALEDAVAILEVLVPIAKAVPVLGAPVEGSLEALKKILEFAQARQAVETLTTFSLADSPCRE
jgi:hypothetical protein